MSDKTFQTKHARITGQDMRDHWGPIIDQIANESEVPQIAAWLRRTGYNQIAAAIEAGEYKEKTNA